MVGRAWTPGRFDELVQRASVGTGPSSGRAMAGVELPVKMLGVPITMTHPGGSVSRGDCCVWTISERSVRVFVRGFLHMGTACELTLTSTDGQTQQVSAVVQECRHLCGLEHCATLRLEGDHRSGVSLDLLRYAPTGALRKQIEAHRQETDRIHGTALVVGHRSSTTQLASFALGRMGLVIRDAETETEAFEVLGENGHVDLMLVDDCPGPQGSGLDVARRVRESWMSLPIIVMTIQGGPVPPELLSSPFLMLLEKPFDRVELASTVRKVLSVGGGADDQVLRSALESDAEIQHIVREFVQRIPESIQRVEEACRRGPLGAIAHEVRRIAEDAMMVGFFLLGEMFMQTWSHINAAENVAGARGHCEEVLPHLRRLYGLERN